MMWGKRKKNVRPTPFYAPTHQEYEDLLGVVSVLSGFSREDLLSSSRTQRVSLWRMSLFYVLRSKGATFHEIGKYFNRNHTTIMYGCRQIEELSNDRMVKEIINTLTEYGDPDNE